MSAPERGAPLTTERAADALIRLLRELSGDDPGEAARKLFADDGDLSASLLASLPRLVNAAAQAVKAFAESVEGLPAQKGAELVAAAHAGISGAEVSEAVKAVSRLIIRVHEEDPGLLPETRAGTMSDFMQAADFGKLRKAVAYKVSERMELLRREVEVLGDTPLALINILSLVAPALNDALPVLKTLFDILLLPAEAVTFALFKILQDIEWRKAAAVINSAAAVIVNIHRGSLVLGDGSLYTRAPFQRISSELVSALDGQVLAEAIAAVGEQAEAFSTALAGKVLENEALALPLFEAVVALSNSLLLIASSLVEAAAALPRETLSGMVASLAEDLEVGELARTVSALAAFSRRVVTENPELVGELSRKTLSALGLEVSPEAAAEGLNRALASYNSWSSGHPDRLAEGVGAFFAGIDARELERAARATSGEVAQVLSRNPQALKAVVGAVLSVAWGTARGYAKSWWDGRKKRRSR